MKYLILICILALWSVTGIALPQNLPLTALSGESVTLNAKPLKLLLFWASWCTDCREKLTTMLPTLDRRADVEVVAINTDSDLERARDFITKNHVALPIYRDPSKMLKKLWQVYSVPYWVVLRKNNLSKNVDDHWSVVDQQAGFEEKRVFAALTTAMTGGRP